MSQVVLILPGATDYELQGRIHGDLDIPLCDEGLQEVDRVARELQDLGLEVVYSSCCSSALQTAEGIAKALGIKVKKLENLQNLDHGLWQGLLIDEVRQKQPKVYRQWQEQPESCCPPEGETIENARGRVAAALTKVFKKHKDGVFGLVVPEPLASVVREHLGQADLGDLWQATSDHGRWSLISFEPGKKNGTARKPAVEDETLGGNGGDATLIAELHAPRLNGRGDALQSPAGGVYSGSPATAAAKPIG